MDHGPLGGGDALQQAVLGVVVHQEADRAAVHAVDRLARCQVAVQRLQHEAVAAQGDDDVGLGLGHLAVARAQPRARPPASGRSLATKVRARGAEGWVTPLRKRSAAALSNGSGVDFRPSVAGIHRRPDPPNGRPERHADASGSPREAVVELADFSSGWRERPRDPARRRRRPGTGGGRCRRSARAHMGDVEAAQGRQRRAAKTPSFSSRRARIR